MKSSSVLLLPELDDGRVLDTVNTLFRDDRDRPIGVFDSGIGGLTVAAALRRRLPQERLLYLGDTARLPYGTKSPATVARYAVHAARFLVGQGVKMMVLACNTASAHASEAVARAFPELMVMGVIEAGAARAAQASPSGRIVVAATEGTCRSGAFERAIAALRPQARVRAIACPMFVPLVEEGLTEGPIAEAMIAQYLGPVFAAPAGLAGGNDCLVLGCTHFPLLTPSLRKVLGPGPVLVDCAEAVAEKAAALLTARAALNLEGPGETHLFTTDAAPRFSASAGRFFPRLGPNPPVDLVDL